MKKYAGLSCLLLFLTTQLAAADSARAPAPGAAPDPETVSITYRVGPGKEAEFLGAVTRHWQTLRKLQLVTAAPHTLVRGKENNGGTYFIEPQPAPARLPSRPRAGRSAGHLGRVQQTLPASRRPRRT